MPEGSLRGARTRTRITLATAALGCAALLGAFDAAAPAFATTSYTSGTYSATGDFRTPGGTQHLSVTLKVKKNKVSSVAVSGVNMDGTSLRYERQFAGKIKKAVVGKKLSTLKVSRVAGASLTSGGFNSAVKAIRTQAKK